MSFNPDPDAVISWVVAGTINLLNAAAKEPSVKSVVLTSSSAATWFPEPNKEIVIDESTRFYLGGVERIKLTTLDRQLE